MKYYLHRFHRFSFFIFLFSFFLIHFPFPASAAPQPSFSYFGQITTELGLPFTPGDQATLIVRSGSRVISRTPVERTGVAGCNYVAEIPLDSDTTPYRDYALKSGATVTFVLADANNREVTLYPVGPIPAVGRPGTTRRLDLSTGLDSVGDGLTDAFRQYILDASQGGFTDLSQVLGGDDFDGDGMSNADEFRAGTDPTWAADILYVAQSSLAQEGRIAFEFFAVEGIAYAIYGSAETNANGTFVWDRVPWSSAPDSNFESGSFTGRGRPATLYLPADQKVKLFKLTVE